MNLLKVAQAHKTPEGTGAGWRTSPGQTEHQPDAVAVLETHGALPTRGTSSLAAKASATSSGLAEPVSAVYNFPGLQSEHLSATIVYSAPFPGLCQQRSTSCCSCSPSAAHSPQENDLALCRSVWQSPRLGRESGIY